MIDPTVVAEQVVELVGDRADAEATVVAGRAELTRFANSFIHQNVGEEYVNVRLRVAADGRTAVVTGNSAEEGALLTLVEGALAAAATQTADPEWAGLTHPTPIETSDFSHPSTVVVTPEDRAAAVKAFVDAGEGYLAAGFCDTDVFDTAYANSAGHRAASRGSRATIDGIHQTGESAGSGHQTARAFAALDPAAAGALAAERARRGTNAYDVKPGEYEVVLGPEAVATIGVFLVVYGFNGKAVNEGQSFLEVGSQQFDDAISFVDDPLGPDALGEAFDTEGTPKSRVVLVDAGVSQTAVHDRRTAGRAGTESTGHAWAQSAAFGPVAGHGVVQPGDDSVEEMISRVARGIYVATFNYCRVLDPRTQVVTGLTRNGTFMIENGAITGALTGMRFTQSFVTALAPGNVLGVGDDVRYADSEFGPGVVRAPSLHLASWNFTGGADG